MEQFNFCVCVLKYAYVKIKKRL